jgi:radical SAM enzyme (TIGR01210 family)
VIYPIDSVERDKWILERRPPRLKLDPLVPYAFSVEDECSSDLRVVPVATVFLTNRECPWKCLMCDLWRNTLTEKVPGGAIPAQIDYALTRLPASRQIKLYNSGSFFDRQAIPLEDYAAIANRINSFERVIVESHPSLLGDSCLRFRDLLKGRLEVAMGLETAHPETLARLNKKMTLEQFSRASEWLRSNAIDLRVFILVKPPFMTEPAALDWAERSLDFAFNCHASVAVLIPTRSGNGALDELTVAGEFCPPKMQTLETAAQYGLGLKLGRVFVDVWDLQRISTCDICYIYRLNRFKEMNLRQRIESPVDCIACRGQQ